MFFKRLVGVAGASVDPDRRIHRADEGDHGDDGAVSAAHQEFAAVRQTRMKTRIANGIATEPRSGITGVR